MRAGDCFHGVIPGSGKIPHYWIILADPDGHGNVPLVNFTSPTGSAKAHLVERAFFPTLDYASEVAWGFATVKPIQAVDKSIQMGLFIPKIGLTKQELGILIAGGLQRGLIRREISKMLI
jgi:hypothetical protein